MATLQHLPHLGTAEDDVLFAGWLVASGSRVHRGMPIATIETLKAVFEIESEHDGVLLRQLCDAGQRVPGNAAIAVVGKAGDACDDAAVRGLLALAPAPAAPPPPAPAAAARVAAAAARRAAELGVDVTLVAGTGPDGLVRAADVERVHATAAAAPAPAGGNRSPDGRVDAAFLACIRADEQAFAALAPDFKLWLYRRHGARLGAGCRLGARTVLLVDRLVLGDAASFGPDCRVEGKDLEAGPLLHFGARCRVRCTRARFGENAYFADDVEIGGGGALDPEAELAVGSHGFVGEHSHLNPCRRLSLGDEVVVSRGAVVMTHSFGPSWLRGYPSRFAGVEVGDGAQIGIGAVLFPGVQVGAGAVILSASSVVTDVPPGRLFGGVPAVDLKAGAQQLSAAEVAQRAAALVAEFARQLQLRGLPAVLSTAGERTTVVVARDDGEHRLEYTARAAFAAGPHAAERVFVAVDFPEPACALVPAADTAIALEPPRIRGPIGPLAGAFREFLRKRGVRLQPRAWTYPGGWL